MDLKKNFQRERISAQTLDNKGIGRYHRSYKTQAYTFIHTPPPGHGDMRDAMDLT